MTPVRLSPLDALIEAGVRVGQRRFPLLRACGLPLAVTVLASGAGSLIAGGAQVALQLSSVGLLGLTAAQVQRVLAAAEPSGPTPSSISVRVWLRYLAWLLTLIIGLGIGVATPVGWMAKQLWTEGDPSALRLNVYLVGAFAIVVAGIYLAARLCLVLPAVALRRVEVLRLAWHYSRDNAAALAVLLLLPERLQWLATRGLGESAASKWLTALLEALAFVAIAALLSVAWSRLAEPQQDHERLRSASPPSLAMLVPAPWATFLLGLPILVSHAWSQADSYGKLLAVRAETALLARSEVASERQHRASLAVLGGDRARGLQLYEEALQLYRDASNPSGEARTLTLIGSLERELGNEPAARAAFESALQRARASGESAIEAAVQKALSAPPSSR